MIKSISISIVLALFAMNGLSAQSIKGEGDIVKQEINLEEIDGIQLAISGDVILTQGKNQKIIIEAQQNIIDNIKKEIEGSSWDISYDKKVKGAKKVTIYITVPTIENIVMAGSGEMVMKNKFSGLDDLNVVMSGSGGINFNVEADEINLAISGSGDVQFAGSGDSFNVAISGSGDVQASDLSVSECAIAVSGSGDVTVNVNGKLDVAISGSGDVKYKGEAQVQSRIVGSGDIVKL